MSLFTKTEKQEYFRSDRWIKIASATCCSRGMKKNQWMEKFGEERCEKISARPAYCLIAVLPTVFLHFFTKKRVKMHGNTSKEVIIIEAKKLPP